MDYQGTPRKRKVHLFVCLLFLLFFTPWVIAWFLYSNTPHSINVTNKGILLNPSIPAVTLQLTNQRHQLVPAKVFKETWSFLYLQSGSCKMICEKNLYKMRQIQLAADKSKPSIRRIIVTFNNAYTDKKLDYLLTHQYAGTQHLLAKKSHLPKIIFNSAGHLSSKGFYLINPFGNLMMHFPLNVPASAISQDMQRLLEVSQIG